MEGKICCMDVPASLDKLIDLVNNAPDDKSARTTVVAQLFHLRDRLRQTPTRGLCPLEAPIPPQIAESEVTETGVEFTTKPKEVLQ